MNGEATSPWIGPIRWIPALTRMPACRLTCSRATVSERSATQAFPPIFRASAWGASWLMSATVTEVPSAAKARAVASPVPEADPVTTAVRPSRVPDPVAGCGCEALIWWSSRLSCLGVVWVELSG